MIFNRRFFYHAVPTWVPGGRIDHAHHYNNPYRALEETLVLESTLEAIMAKVDLSETLIVVTADHSHVMTMGGLATPRGNDILGKFVRLYSSFINLFDRLKADFIDSQ